MDDLNILKTQEFVTIVSTITSIDWKRLGRALLVPDYELDAIDDDDKRVSEKSFRMICKWRDSKNNPTLDELNRALESIGRMDVVREIRSYLLR